MSTPAMTPPVPSREAGGHAAAALHDGRVVLTMSEDTAEVLRHLVVELAAELAGPSRPAAPARRWWQHRDDQDLDRRLFPAVHPDPVVEARYGDERRAGLRAEVLAAARRVLAAGGFAEVRIDPAEVPDWISVLGHAQLRLARRDDLRVAARARRGRPDAVAVTWLAFVRGLLVTTVFPSLAGELRKLAAEAAARGPVDDRRPPAHDLGSPRQRP
ncbi:hypothetical protein C1701_06785 [Actinoalloteichus sp. AHMU CJ021]|uniref:DUF2017 family protein n=1 Tax=Actinoalloteichus caeruleus DSM 43889 TaxID=1120930 RepID=A0ABT1JHZ2_ACTCY|nr:hypothetical protein [Actinoalloteichus caeruleus]AUS78128.1 hypothetical protein C1701_06785 [Actinoalloteichus sp. AHMU CJ021]MCP2332136.1 hypothetical protein [Actinoalloteichus caeruleus DSM 43889]